MRKIVDANWSHSMDVISTLVVGCIERRIRGWRGGLGEAMGFETAYPMLIPGGVKDLVMPKQPRDAEFLLEKIELISPHIRMLVIMAHDDCLACERCRDKIFYEKMLLTAAAMLRKRFARLEVIPIYVDFGGIYFAEDDTPVGMAVA